MEASPENKNLMREIRRMAPVWAIITLATVGSLAAIRMNGVEYLRRGIYAHADTCQVGEVHFHAAQQIWRNLAAEATASHRDKNAASSLGILANNSELAEARAKLEEAIRVCPRISGAHDLLADLAWWSGDEAATHYHLGMEHLQKSELDAARVEFITAQQKAPDDEATVLALLDVMTRTQDWQAAQQVLDAAPSEVQNSAEGLRLRAHFAREGGDLVQAEALLKQSLDQSPGFRPAVLDLVSVYYTESNFSNGPDWLMQNLQTAVAPEAADYHAIGLLFSEGGENEKALEALERGLAIQPNSTVLSMEKALALYRLNRQQEAKLAAQSALDKNPKEFIRIIEEKRFEPLAQYR